MRLVTLAVSSLSPTVGAVRTNAALVLAEARAMADAGVSLGAFPEQVLGGYPPEDLVQWRAFLDAQRRALDTFAADTADLPTVFVLGLAVPVDALLFNAAAVVHGGRVLGCVPKEKLPTYNVFYEGRTFSRGGPGVALDAAGVPLGDFLFAFDFGTVAVEVCEDAWAPDGPMRRRCQSGAEIVVNVSASPYRMGIAAARILGLAADAAPAEAGRLITAFYMPTRHSQDATRSAAHELAAALGVALHTVPLDDAYDREVEVARQMLGGQPPGEMTRQNVQARLRGQRMWNWANTSGALFLQTGDMSEKAVGYTTIGGDLEGSLSVIANVPKTVVEALLARLDRRYGFAGIAATLATAPGPELADAQVAEHELMPFPILDACLHLYASEKLSPAEVAVALTSVCPGYEPAYLAACAQRFARLFTQSIYKWVQSPLALHVGSLDLDRERALQMPVVQRTEW